MTTSDHEGHELAHIMVSWGTILECWTCERIVWTWHEEADNPITDYVPAGVTYSGPTC